MRFRDPLQAGGRGFEPRSAHPKAAGQPWFLMPRDDHVRRSYHRVPHPCHNVSVRALLHWRSAASGR